MFSFVAIVEEFPCAFTVPRVAHHAVIIPHAAYCVADTGPTPLVQADAERSSADRVYCLCRRDGPNLMSMAQVHLPRSRSSKMRQLPEPDLEAFQLRLGYRFTDPQLLRTAVKHRSWCAERDKSESNERLEFLGDSVVSFVIADMAFRMFKNMAEGQLTDLRKSLVHNQALADLATGLGIGDALLLGRGADEGGGRQSPNLLADAFEAVIGAVFVDGGMGAASEILHRLWAPLIIDRSRKLWKVDPKTRLIELTGQRNMTCTFETVHSGPEHAKSFAATVVVDGQLMGSGTSGSRRKSDQLAAAQALLLLDRPMAPESDQGRVGVTTD